MSRTCEDCKWMKDGWDYFLCTFRAAIPKSAEIQYHSVEWDDKKECPTWEPKANPAAKPSNPLTPKGGEA